MATDNDLMSKVNDLANSISQQIRNRCAERMEAARRDERQRWRILFDSGLAPRLSRELKAAPDWQHTAIIEKYMRLSERWLEREMPF